MATGTTPFTRYKNRHSLGLYCSLCEGRYKQPKILDCMHNFCEKCLEKYCNGRYKGAARIPCPSCHQEMAVPEQGVQGLTTNYHLIGKVEKSLQEKVARARSGVLKLICETCEEGNKATYFCLDCAQNICSNCQRRHLKIATTASHKIATLKEIQQGKVELKQDYDDGSRCHRHREEVKKFYCEICKELICQDCANEDHLWHNYTDSSAASDQRKNSLTELFPVITRYLQELERSLAAKDQAKQELANEMKITIQDVKDGTAKMRAEITSQENDFIVQIKTTENSRCKLIDENKETVTMVLQTAQYSLEMAKDIESTASDSHFLSLYPTISNMLKSLSNQRPPETDQRLSHLKFRQTPEVESVCLGKLELEFKWQMCTEIETFGEGRSFRFVGGIVALHPDEIAVTDSGYTVWLDSNIHHYCQVVILSIKGKLRRRVPLTSSSTRQPLSIAATQNQIVVADGGAYNVRLYQKDNLRSFGKFNTLHSWSDYFRSLTQSTKLESVAIKKDGTIVVGDTLRKVLTEHISTNGSVTYTRTIPLKLTPSYLAVDTTDRLIASDQHEGKVAVLKDNGDEAFTIKPTIKGHKKVQCKGVCCDSSGIYVALHASDNGTGHIHRYDATSGVFLSCIIQDLHQPCGITFTADGLQLAVVDNKSVKMYHTV